MTGVPDNGTSLVIIGCDEDAVLEFAAAVEDSVSCGAGICCTVVWLDQLPVTGLMKGHGLRLAGSVRPESPLLMIGHGLRLGGTVRPESPLSTNVLE